MTFAGDNSPMTHCRFTPDGSRVVSCSGSPEWNITTWDVTTGARVSTFCDIAGRTLDWTFAQNDLWLLRERVSERYVLDLARKREITVTDRVSDSVSALSRDGRRVAVAMNDGIVTLVDADTDVVVSTYPGDAGKVRAIALSATGDLCAIGAGDNTLRVWNTVDGTELAVLKGHTAPVNRCVFVPGTLRLISAAYDGTTRGWDVSTARQTFEIKEAPSGLECSPDGEFVALRSSDEVAVIKSDTGARHCVVSLPRRTVIYTAAFAQDSRRLAVGDADGDVGVCDLDAPDQTWHVAGHTGPVRACAFSPVADLLLTASEDQTLKLWEYLSDVRPTRAPGHDDRVTACALSPDGRRAITAGLDGSARIWNTDTGQLLVTWRPERAEWAEWVLGCALSPDGRLAATVHDHHGVTLWDSETGTDICRLLDDPPLPDASSGTVAFSPDGATLVYVNALDCVLFDVANRRQVATLQYQLRSQVQVSPESYVLPFLFSPDGSWLLMPLSEDTLDRINVRDGSVIASIDVPINLRACAISDDGRLIAAAFDDGARVWDCTDEAQEIAWFEVRGASACAFARGGEVLLIGSGAGMSMWRLVDMEQVAAFSSHRGAVVHCECLPGGRLILSVSSDLTVEVRDVESGRVECEISGRIWDALRHDHLVPFAHHKGHVVIGNEDGSVGFYRLEGYDLDEGATRGDRSA